MFTRLSQTLCIAALAASAPAYAAEVWDCTYTSGVRQQIQIDGKALDLKRDARFGLSASTRYEVLENNDVAIVAAKSSVFDFRSLHLGQGIGAAIITINKMNGEFVLAIVDDRADIQPQRERGVCKLNSAAP